MRPPPYYADLDFNHVGAGPVKQQICDAAKTHGFDACHIVSAESDAKAGQGLQDFIAAGHHGQMDWMENRMDERRAAKIGPKRKASSCWGSITALSDPLAALTEADKGVISVYAQRRDYHDVIKKKLKALARWLVGETQAEVKVFVDTASGHGKAAGHARRFGLAGQTHEFGIAPVWFLAVWALYLPAAAARCAGRRPLRGVFGLFDICPTNAFPAPYQLDARRCISYRRLSMTA